MPLIGIATKLPSGLAEAADLALTSLFLVPVFRELLRHDVLPLALRRIGPPYIILLPW